MHFSHACTASLHCTYLFLPISVAFIAEKGHFAVLLPGFLNSDLWPWLTVRDYESACQISGSEVISYFERKQTQSHSGPTAPAGPL